MTAEECIDTYTSLSDGASEKINDQIQGRLAATEPERIIEQILTKGDLSGDGLLKDSPDAHCNSRLASTFHLMRARIIR